MDAHARSLDDRIRQVTISLATSWQVVEILRPGGDLVRDVRPLVRASVAIVAGQGDRQESGMYGFGGRKSYDEFLSEDNWQHAIDEALAASRYQSRCKTGTGWHDGCGAGCGLARCHAA